MYLLYLLYSTAWWYFGSDKTKLLTKNFSKNSTLEDSGIPLPAFPSRSNLKLHNVFVSPKMATKIIMNLDSSKASGPDCIPVVVRKNCDHELSSIPAEIFNMCLKKSFFQIVRMSRRWSLYLRMLGERSTAKSYGPVSLLPVVSQVFEKLANNSHFDNLEKYGLFSDFQYGFRSFHQLQIFCQLHLIELVGILTGLVLLEL